MSDNDILKKKTDELSMDFILMDSENIEEIRAFVAELKFFETWAENNSKPLLKSDANKLTDTANLYFSEKGVSKGDLLSLIEKFLSELQLRIKNNDWSKKSVTTEKTTNIEPSSEGHKQDKLSDDIPDPDNASADQYLNHPSELPQHLDMELFEEFLELQSISIDQMEECLLSFEKTSDKEHIQNLKRLIHTQKGEAGFLNLAETEAILHEMEDFLETDSINIRTDLFFSVIDWLRKTNSWYRGTSDKQPESPQQMFKTFVDLISKSSEHASNTNKNISVRSEHLPESSALQKEKSKSHVIRVETEQLDILIDMIGELVTAEAIVVQSAEIRAIQSSELHKNIDRLNSITRTLHEICLKLRMVSLKSSFQKMERLALDVARKSGKQVICDISGEDTKLDKTLVDQIGEPLLHIVRNTIVHGIENSTEERTTKGKQAHGLINIKAFQKNGYVHIEVEDDGRGINTESILKKAIETGRLSPSIQYQPRDIINLIFEPGFSTAEKITDLSGRGQGMSVVKNVIESLKGHIDCQSVPGKGSKFTLKIPLTLAIIDGMLVKSGDDLFIIPALSVVTSAIVDENNITATPDGEKTVLFHNSIVPFTDLDGCFSTNKEKTDNNRRKLMLIVESSARRMAVAVDEIIGKQQVVIKNMNEELVRSPGISGAAIMHDGSVCLIIDVDYLINRRNI